jgi:rubredoxin
MTDVGMGQVLNTVTCPVCQFSSRNFDPFNLLSIPFPTVADVIFKCYVVRRASAFNAPWVLNKPRKGGKWRTRFVRRDLLPKPKPPSEQLVVEQYIIAMSRLADSGDLKLQIQNLCGISANDLRMCRAEEVVMREKDDNTVVRRQTQVTLLTDKEGPCSQFARQRANSEDVGTAPTSPSLIVAFESTLRPRPADDKKSEEDSSDSNGDDEEEEETDKPGMPSKKELKELEKHVAIYGNPEECRLYDTETLPIAKATSRSLWPRTEDELKLGLRVDAIDHREHWFPGSVVEILESGNNGESKETDGAKTKVRIHFDNFSSKWDEMYTIDHFNEGRVRPLYSHASPRAKPTEFAVHHRYTDRATRLSNLFGQSFYVQCHNEWSTARAGAQILSQASRFLRQSLEPQNGPVDLDDADAQEREAKVQRLYDRTQAVISDLIDLLIDCDREYVYYALGVAPDPNAPPNKKFERFRNPGFDATALSSSLVKRVNALLHRLPFEVRVCTVDSPLGGTNEEVAFPFSLMRTIGNYMNARHAVVLQWREPPSDKKSTSGRHTNYLGAPVMYVPPKVAIDEISADILNKVNQKAKRSSSSHGSGGLQLGVCLTEFCKVQQLSISDNWRCPRCRDFREGKQNLTLWRLPDLLTFHIKRFNCSARWREKITTKVNFPLTGLDMKEWCHKESPAIQTDSGDSYVYDLIGVLNHYGGMTGGHYVATCKATACGRDGREEVAYDFNGAGAGKPIVSDDDPDVQTGWRIGRQKAEVNFNKVNAASTAKAAAESAEPLWLQFDDDLVEPIPPRYVVSEMAYVLFYRRRRMTPSNIARYSTLE